MKSTLSDEASAALADLVKKWPKLENDVARAMTVAPVARLKVSTRVLAEQLGCSPTQIRTFLEIAKAPWQDQLLARRGEISTRELVRRSRTADAGKKEKNQQALDRRRMKEAKRACETICNWLEEEKRGSARGEAIIDETRRIFAVNTRDETLPKCAPPVPGTPVKTIIEQLRPSKFVNEDIGSISWYADWLARWTFFAYPDEIVRDRALNLALDAEIRRV